MYALKELLILAAFFVLLVSTPYSGYIFVSAVAGCWAGSLAYERRRHALK